MRILIWLVPVILSTLVLILAANAYPADELGWGAVPWWLAFGSLAVAVLLLTDRLARRFLPVPLLLRMALSFPDRAPSRFGAALRYGTARKLMERNPPTSEALLQLVQAISRHDRATRGHSERVRAYSQLIGEDLGLTEREMDRLAWAALLHDVGKLEVSSDILNKDGPPDDEEWSTLRRHPEHAAAYLSGFEHWLDDWGRAASEHHERWDGRGYPNGLEGEQIHRAARIVAVADAYDVMTSARSYKKPMATTVARQEIARNANKQFDPVVVRSFLNVGIGQISTKWGALAWLTQIPDYVSRAPAVGLAVAVGLASAVGLIDPSASAEEQPVELVQPAAATSEPLPDPDPGSAPAAPATPDPTTTPTATATPTPVASQSAAGAGGSGGSGDSNGGDGGGDDGGSGDDGGGGGDDGGSEDDGSDEGGEDDGDDDVTPEPTPSGDEPSDPPTGIDAQTATTSAANAEAGPTSTAEATSIPAPNADPVFDLLGGVPTPTPTTDPLAALFGPSPVPIPPGAVRDPIAPPSPTATVTPPPTATPVPKATPTPAPTPTPLPTAIPTPTPTATPTPTPLPTPTATPTPTPTPLPTPTATPMPTPTPSATPSPTPTPTTPPPLEVTLYDFADFGAEVGRVGPGTYSFGDPAWTWENDDLESLRVPAGLQVTVCRNVNLGQPCISYTADVASLPASLNDQVSSLQVVDLRN